MLLIAGAIGLLSVAATGCGGNSQADANPPTASRAFKEMVTGLKNAAVSNRPYGATRRASRLAKAEQAVVAGFCEFAWQIPVNHLVHLLPQHVYVVTRITHLSELEYRGGAVSYQVRDAPVEASLAALRKIVDLRALNGSLIRRYSRACAH